MKNSQKATVGRPQPYPQIRKRLNLNSSIIPNDALYNVVAVNNPQLIVGSKRTCHN